MQGLILQLCRANWLTTITAKEVAATASSQAPPGTQSHISPLSPDTKYCAICSPLGKICPNKYPMSLDWDEDLKEQERKNQEIEDQKDNDRKPPKQAPNLHQLIPLLLSPPNPPAKS